jgi:hypothetical protein
MITKGLIISSIILALFAGCSGDYELDRSVFIHDPEFTGLPAYSEWGYNTFGAYYDGEVFVSNDYLSPARIMVEDNSMTFILNGQRGPSEYYSENTGMTMAFLLPGFSPENYQDLTVFNDSTIDLKNSAWQVQISIGTMVYTADIQSGELQFKRVQNLMVDKSPEEVILSGYFEFQAFINGSPKSVTNGRFDVGIGGENFFRHYE